MTFLILAYLGGVLTILSPCILPVLPFVFARADQPFRRAGLPMLLGMAITFALVAMLAAVGGAWAVHANIYGRYVALLILALFGLTLLLPRFADRLMHPLVTLGARLSASSAQDDGAPSTLSSIVLGIGTGLLWAPCAGPILGLVLTGAALHGANVGTFGLLLAYAAGAATTDSVDSLRGLRAPIASMSFCSTPFVPALDRRVSQPVSTPSATAATATSTATPSPRRTHSPAPSEFFSAPNTRPPISSANASDVAAPAA